MFTKHHAKCCPKRSPFRWVSKIMSRKRHEGPCKVSFKMNLFHRVSKIMSQKRHEAPRKVSSKTESFGCILKIPSRKRREKYNACIGEIPTLKTNFFCLDPPNICSRNTTQSFLQSGVVWSCFQNNESKESRSTTQSFVQNGV